MEPIASMEEAGIPEKLPPVTRVLPGFEPGHFIYSEFGKSVEDRAISEQELLRAEAVEVWKEYRMRKDKVDY